MKVPSVRTIVAVAGLAKDAVTWVAGLFSEKEDPPMPLTERDVQIQLQAAKNAGPKGKR